MWFLNFIPDSIIAYAIHGLFFFGLIGVVLSFVILNRVLLLLPALAPYHKLLQIISLIIFLLAIFLEGGLQVEKSWRDRVAELQEKVKIAEAKSKEENVKIVEKVVTKTKIVKERGEEIVKYIDREIVKYDERFAKGSQCEIPKEFMKALNDAAERPKK